MASPIAVLVAILALLLAIAGFLRWCIGRPAQTHPACRACRADARGRIRASPVACAGCGAPLSAPGAIVALGRRRPRRRLVLCAVAFFLGAGILLIDRRIAAVGMRWDTAFIPVAGDIAMLRASPQAATGALDRLWLRTIRGRLSPEEASAVVDALLARPAVLRHEESARILLDVAGLRAARIEDVDRYLDELSLLTSVTGPHEAVRPGGRFRLLVKRSQPPSPWAQYYLVRSIRVNGSLLRLEGGPALAEGLLEFHLSDCLATLPETMPEGEHDLEILFDEIFVPNTMGSIFEDVVEGASIDALPVKLLRRERSERGVLRVRHDGPAMMSEEGDDIVWLDYSSQLPAQALFAEELPPRALFLIILVTAIGLLLFMLGNLVIHRLGGFKPILIVPRCAGCGMELHAEGVQCAECGRDASTSPLPIAIGFATSRLRLMLVRILRPVAGAALVFAGIAAFEIIDQRARDAASTSAGRLAELEAAIPGIATHGLGETTGEQLWDLLQSVRWTYLRPDETDRPDPSRLIEVMHDLLAALDRRPNPSAARWAYRSLYSLLALMAADEEPELRAACFEILKRPISLYPLQHRAGTWRRITIDNPYWHPHYDRLVIEGVEHRPSQPAQYPDPLWFRSPGQPPVVEILTPETPGFFEVTMIAEASFDPDARTRKVIQLEVVPAGEPIAQYTTNPYHTPFAGPPTLLLCEIDDRVPGGRWRTYLLTSPGDMLEGRWSIETPRGVFEIDWGRELDPRLLGPPGTPVLLRYDPPPLEDSGLDWPGMTWGATETWQVVPELRPLGWWDGE